MARSVADPGGPARAAALRVIERTTTEGAYADRALHAEAAGLAPWDRALAKRLAFGAVQRRGSLDWVIERHADRRLDPPIRAALQLGLYQLLFTEIPDHAAIGESVALVRSHPGHRLVNAVLRTVQREGVRWPGDGTPADAAVTHSHPEWLVRMWWAWLGPEETRALLRADNEPAELALRVNPLAGLAVELGGRRDGDALVLDQPLDLFAHPLYRAGAITPQSRASQRVAVLVDPQPGERILDLCAAPGGKTAHLLERADLDLTALDIDPARCERIRGNLRRLGLTARVLAADAAQPASWWDGEPYDGILLDAPCTASGIVRRHPDVRWLRRESDVAQLERVQAQLLDTLWPLLRPGGCLVFCTCSVFRAEGSDQAQAFLARHTDARILPAPGHLLPTNGARASAVPDNAAGDHDGFFYAAFRKVLG